MSNLSSRSAPAAATGTVKVAATACMPRAGIAIENASARAATGKAGRPSTRTRSRRTRPRGRSSSAGPPVRLWTWNRASNRAVVSSARPSKSAAVTTTVGRGGRESRSRRSRTDRRVVTNSDPPAVTMYTTTGSAAGLSARPDGGNRSVRRTTAIPAATFAALLSSGEFESTGRGGRARATTSNPMATAPAVSGSGMAGPPASAAACATARSRAAATTTRTPGRVGRVEAHQPKANTTAAIPNRTAVIVGLRTTTIPSDEKGGPASGSDRTIKSRPSANGPVRGGDGKTASLGPFAPGHSPVTSDPKSQALPHSWLSPGRSGRGLVVRAKPSRKVVGSR